MATKQIIGYTCGVYDLFHIGHLNLLKNAKALCDKLVVGVTVDELVPLNKNKKCIIPYRDRAEIISSIKYVDCIIPQTSMDKLEAYHKLKYDILFVGDDWYQKEDWKILEKELGKFDVVVRYFPYTKNISSTQIIKNISEQY
jgi:glycerol-3-phosphate cytidylyltransferase